MSKKLDNHIDELELWGEIKSPDGDGAEGYIKLSDEARQKLDQYYADFYRNKIPEKRTLELYTESVEDHMNPDFPEIKRKRTERYNTALGYNQAIDDITAQFNVVNTTSTDKGVSEG